MKLPGVAGSLSELKAPVVIEMLEMARSMEEEGGRVIRLVRGEPDFDTPLHIREAAKVALDGGYTHYAPLRGYLELREAVARKMERENGLTADPGEEVIITAGATMGMFIALAAVLNPGEEVLLPDPVYDPYVNLVRLFDCMPVFIPAESDDGRFRLDFQAAVKRLSSRTKALVLNNPWNPVGAVMEEEELEALAVLVEGNNLYLVVDEIYEKIIFSGHRHRSIAALIPDIRERTITVNSFSKTYAMTGWRLGYNIAPHYLTSAMLKAYQQCSRGPASFVQRAGLAALDGPQDSVAMMMREYLDRREILFDGLATIEGLEPVEPEGTFFMFTRVDNEEGADSRRLAVSLLKEAGVLVTPGRAFGSGGEGYLRFSFAHSREMIEDGLRGVAEYMSAFRGR